MSNITSFLLGVIVFSVIDYLLFIFQVIVPEKPRWEWFVKRTNIQKLGFLASVFVVLFIVNYLTY